jgi:trans-aconitate 2-methyltransferase
MSPHDWDGATYDRISGPIYDNSLTVLERLELCGDETVLDAGCGSGRITEALLERLPRGHVIGVDGSPAMIEAASRRVGTRAQLIVCDLCELDLGGPVLDAVLSTAVFHWIADHGRLFARLRANMRPGGRLVAQCGGEGNVPELMAATATVSAAEPFAGFLEGFCPWNYQSPRATERRLLSAGFEQVRTSLAVAPHPYDDLAQWLGSNALSAHLLRLPEELRDGYVEAVLDALGPDPQTTYIRLNIDAVAG